MRTLRKLTSALAVATVGAACLAGTAGAATITTTYGEDALTPIANPERGFYRQQGECDRDAFNPDTLRSWRVTGDKGVKSNLVMCVFYLAKRKPSIKTSGIPAETLTFFNNQAQAVRDAGLKMIVRFAYTESSDDAEPIWVQRHLDDLTPVLRNNADVIAVLESGFVGAWGEGSSTQHFGDEGQIEQADWTNRNAIVTKLLQILPANRKVLVRTRQMKEQLFGETTFTTPADVSAQRPIARVGYHNDCIFGNDGAQGYYQANDRDDVIRDTGLVPIGGEGCGTIEGSRGQCANALAELDTLRFSFLNRDWGEVTDTWGPAGCLDDMERLLGYRFALKSFTAPTSVARGGKLPFTLQVRNTGWASTMNHRQVMLGLRHTDTKRVHRFQVGSTRPWTPKTTYTLNHAGISIPATMPTGRYEVLLSAPDPASSLTTRPEYAIRFANTGELWEQTPETGFNKLLHTVNVT